MEKTIWRTETLFVCKLKNYSAIKEKNLVKIKVNFFKDRDMFVREILYSIRSNRCFVLYDKKEDLNDFCDYNLKDAITEERVYLNCKTDWKKSQKNYGQYVIWKNRGSKEWYYAHPYQGGSCRGK